MWLKIVKVVCRKLNFVVNKSVDAIWFDVRARVSFVVDVVFF